MSRLAPSAFALLAFLAFLAPAAWAAPPPDEEIARAEEEQDRQLDAARRGGSMAGVVATAQSRYMRQPSLLNHYLLARALFHHGDEDGARRALEQIVAQEPELWQAQTRLAFLAWKAKNAALARRHLDLARVVRPDAPEVLRLAADVGASTKDWDLALAALSKLAELDPKNVSVRLGLAEVLAAKGDWQGAYQEARALRGTQPKDLRVRWVYANASYQTKRWKEAIDELEDLAKGDPQGVQYVDLLRRVYAEQKDWPRLASALERLRPFVKPEERAKLDEAVAALKSGQADAESVPVPQPEVDPVFALFDRCLAPDPLTRRVALQDLHAARLGSLPEAIVLRYHPETEPDAECRSWVLRLLGALGNPLVAKVPGHALQDPDPLVRRVAAEALGDLATPSGLAYLIAWLPDLPLGADATPAVVAQYNAGRTALAKITRFDDLPAGTTWVEAAGLTASWERWRAWLASPDGVRAKLKAIEDLQRVREPHPEWYLLVMMYDPDLQVLEAAHRALVERAKAPTEDPVAKRLWPQFPPVGPQGYTAAGAADLRQRVKAWWSAWLAERTGAR
jgi:tetratricopeptide (TPR) repeat protein